MLITTVLLATAALAQEPAAEEPATVLQEAPEVVDAKLDAWRVLLLDQAYQAGSLMPESPFIKDRSRAQERVVVAALQLGLPVRALRYIEGIDNWRRGSGYADHARYCAEHGFQAEVEPSLEAALEIARQPTGEADQQWRRDRILSKVAATRYVLGQEEAAAELSDKLEVAQQVAARAAQAEALSSEEFDAEIKRLRELAEVAGFDRKQVGIAACVRMYDRFFDDADRRGKLLVTIEDLWQKIPADVQLSTLMDLADICLQHGKVELAARHTSKAWTIYDSYPWSAEFGVPWAGKLAGIHARAGQPEETRGRVEAALSLYEEGTKTILGIDRADALRPVAEAAQALGDREQAIRLYSKVLEVGADNPNARPRADDLVLTCISMAIHEFEPTEGQASRIAELVAGLEAPW